MKEEGLSLIDLVSDLQIVLVAGSGGVGKTTTSAALGVALATSLEKEVLVITIDPAKRLAGAMGIDALSHVPQEVQLKDAKGHLFAAMVDMKASWDEMISRYAPDKDTVQKIVENPIYESISTRFVQSHDYIAVEALYEFYKEGIYDIIVVDTPPSRNAIDFLDAPKNMEEFFASRLLRWLTIPRRSKLVASAFRPFYLVAERILGSAFVKDISEFFFDFQQLYEGFVARARQVAALVASDKAGFIVVTIPEEIPTTEAIFFISEVARRKLNMSAVVMNRSLPASIFSRAGDEVADKISNETQEMLAKTFDAIGLDPTEGEVPLASKSQLVSKILVEMANSYEGLRDQKTMEEIQVSRLTVREGKVFTTTQQSGDVSSVESLRKLATNMSIYR
ncbi:Anion-transporting ATPase, ArsA/GET3 family [Ferrithrix thermotolerans DSM 19514]|uniref:Anion-transporting ATPase, ArsA/GET3 family n=1 Tax=Ferrithrix thermotolerans DSM 19514 TaxID=1121881 RepID=A0A1M4U4C3_9ACTN|nr:ArsA-related P-loop ATPase [Ferrithrix thermotolerans]SHE51470.1 Anion-transporting ATPase, ArsA/GET3 family [Ferrithrix thermotolerans DSM 19514]